jgi:hypothetical protein
VVHIGRNWDASLLKRREDQRSRILCKLSFAYHYETPVGILVIYGNLKAAVGGGIFV